MLSLKHRVAAGAFALALSPFAMAQTKAALVRSVDEPGRVPYSETGVPNCNDRNCPFKFAAVPAGKRLVIEHVGGVARSTSDATIYSDAELHTSGTITPGSDVMFNFRMALLQPAGANTVFNGYYFNAPVKAYVEAGSAPLITIYESTAGPTIYARASISGYLVDVAP